MLLSVQQISVCESKQTGESHAKQHDCESGQQSGLFTPTPPPQQKVSTSQQKKFWNEVHALSFLGQQVGAFSPGPQTFVVLHTSGHHDEGQHCCSDLE